MLFSQKLMTSSLFCMILFHLNGFAPSNFSPKRTELEIISVWNIDFFLPPCMLLMCRHMFSFEWLASGSLLPSPPMMVKHWWCFTNMRRFWECSEESRMFWGELQNTQKHSLLWLFKRIRAIFLLSTNIKL